MSYSAYIICATPRSGSTLLCDMLTASGMAGQPHSYFRSQDIHYWAGLWNVHESIAGDNPEFNRAYLAAMKRAGTADSGFFGLRLMWQSIDEATVRLASALGSDADIVRGFELAFGPTLFIYLSRQDKVAQAVSLVRAEQTGLWHVAADGSERERTATARAPVFDATQIARTRDMLASDDDRWSSFFNERGIHPLRLLYENLAADPRSALADVLTALGCDPTRAAKVNAITAKMADATNADWTRRMRAD